MTPIAEARRSKSRIGNARATITTSRAGRAAGLHGHHGARGANVEVHKDPRRCVRFIAPLRLRAVAPSPARPADAFDRARADATRRPHLLSPGNWLEDRDQAPPLDTTQRVTPKATPASTYETSSSAIGVAAEVPRGSRPVKSMLAAINFSGARPSVLGRSPLGGYGAIFAPSRPCLLRDGTRAIHELDPRGRARLPRAGGRRPGRRGYPGESPRDRTSPSRATALFSVNATRRDFCDDFKRDTREGAGVAREAAHPTAECGAGARPAGRRVRRGTVTKTTFCASNPSKRPPRT